MKRAIVQPAVLAGSALDELKQWLGLSRTTEDAMLEGLLRAALDMCEGFTGTMPLEVECEETLPPVQGWQCLSTRPVQAITAIETVTSDGTRAPLDLAKYAIELDADGTGRIALKANAGGARLAVRLVAGLAPDWDALPDSLRQGAIRLAAHLYRDREVGETKQPPAAVTALWRPWRRLRLL